MLIRKIQKNKKNQNLQKKKLGDQVWKPSNIFAYKYWSSTHTKGGAILKEKYKKKGENLTLNLSNPNSRPPPGFDFLSSKPAAPLPFTNTNQPAAPPLGFGFFFLQPEAHTLSPLPLINTKPAPDPPSQTEPSLPAIQPPTAAAKQQPQLSHTPDRNQSRSYSVSSTATAIDQPRPVTSFNRSAADPPVINDPTAATEEQQLRSVDKNPFASRPPEQRMLGKQKKRTDLQRGKQTRNGEEEKKK